MIRAMIDTGPGDGILVIRAVIVHGSRGWNPVIRAVIDMGPGDGTLVIRAVIGHMGLGDGILVIRAMIDTGLGV